MNAKFKLSILLFFIIITSFTLLYGYISKVKNETVVFHATNFLLKKNTHLKQMLRQLYSNNIDISYLNWRIISFLNKKKIVLKAGEYFIPKGYSIQNIIDLFHTGNTITRRFTLVEGWTALELKKKMLNTDSLSGDMPELKEGIYKPDNYKWGFPRKKLLRLMKLKQTKLINEIWKNLPKRFVLKSKKELVILASIIQKETAAISDSELVASVFINRLKKKMRLQSDVTLAYGLNINGTQITKKHLKSFHPFNTYLIDGLPPTPISYPGKQALNALNNYKKTNYFYFVSNGKGGHRFSKTYKLHKKNIKLWKKSLTKGSASEKK